MVSGQKACSHLTAACLQENVNLPDLKSLARSLRTIHRTKKRFPEQNNHDKHQYRSARKQHTIANS